MSLLKGRFRLERELGSGGMARVFLGADEVLGRTVAVKILKPGFAGSDISDRFRREGRTFARLSHPNIVQVYDAGEADLDGREVSYIVMEYVSGGDLKQLVDQKGSLEEGELVRIGTGAASALAHAHGRGVIHRDVKPHNILLDGAGSPRLTDFGIARAFDATYATRTGTYLGTALYSSPEQLRGEKATAKSDVYSLGVTLYQAATGEPPFTGSPLELADQHATKDPVSPRENGATVGAAMETLILDCLAKDPDARPTAEEVRNRLVEACQVTSSDRIRVAPTIREPASAGRGRPGPSARSGNRQRARGVLALLALLVVAALAGVALAVPNLIGTNAGSPQGGKKEARPSAGVQKPPRQEAKKREPARKKPAQQKPSQQAAARPQATVSEQKTVPQQTAQNSGEQDGSAGGLTAAAAEKTVEEMYTSAAAKNYNASYDLLSTKSKQNTVGSEANWAGTFDTLESIRFIQGPTATVNGDTATVTGTTIAVHVDHTERNTGTWTLVDEGGQWKVNYWSVEVRRI